MILLSDTRQQIGKHGAKEKYFLERGVEIKRTKLYVGDYTLPVNQSVCVDTKKDIQELIGDICTKSHDRFKNECIRAQESGIKLIILIENTDGVKSIDDVFRWQNPRMHRYNKIAYMHNLGKWLNVSLPKAKPTSGETLAKAMLTMQLKYGVKFLFCRPDEAGEKILELLGVDADGREKDVQ